MKKGIVVLILICFWACNDILEVENISNKFVEILAPTDGVNLNSETLTFTWSPLDGAEQYLLQVSTPNFEVAQQIVVDTILTKLNYTTTLENGTYQWRIKALNSAYESEFITQNFTIEE